MDHRQVTLPQTTTTQAAKAQQRHNFQATTLAGIKRTFSEALPQLEHRESIIQRDGHRRASSLSTTLSRLVASPIFNTVDEPKELSTTSRPCLQSAITSIPALTLDSTLLLSHPRYAIPGALVKNFAGVGIKEIYPWQKYCLMGPGLLEGTKNLVYTAPTGGGKSLVADVLMLKRVLEDPKAKAILVLPYVALVQEKVRWLRKVLQDISRKGASSSRTNQEPTLWQRRPDEDVVRVVGFFGGGKVRAVWSDFDIAVCTFEKVL